MDFALKNATAPRLNWARNSVSQTATPSGVAFLFGGRMISRPTLAGFFAAAWLCAAPQPLTTIQDTLYKADGTRFNGSLVISWTTFEAVDHTQILQQTATVQVVDG